MGLYFFQKVNVTIALPARFGAPLKLDSVFISIFVYGSGKV